VLGPSVRWFFRRRMERAVTEVNKRLAKPIEPFRLARRHDTIQRLLYDPNVIEAVAEHAATEGIPKNVAFQQAERYAREIVPRFSATAYFGIGTRVARFLSETLYRVRLAHFDDEALAQIDKDATVIFVMNHRSNMDYILVTYMAAGRTALSYAVGEWAQVWPLSGLIRSMGAYFIRRKSRNALYRRVLARYVQIATSEGVTQAVFPEGGLSLDGRTAPAKLGILNYIVTGWQGDKKRNVVFVPVALNYDRVLEDHVLVEAAKSTDHRFRYRFWQVAGYVARRIWQWMRGRFRRFGYAAVSFGAPLSLSELAKGQPAAKLTERVALRLMERISALVPVLPIPLTSALLIRHPGGISRAALQDEFNAALSDLKSRNIFVQVARDNPELTLELALRGLTVRGLIRADLDTLAPQPQMIDILNFYAASIEHHLRANRTKN
ncbi:MAG: 1-acyl-sn-glycerol-3-phosphate acyltransferase, partial [Deltaproteobacteria bacterium]